MSQTNEARGHEWERAVTFLWGEAERKAEFWPARDAGEVWRDLANEINGMVIFAIWQGCAPDVIKSLDLLRGVASERARMIWKPEGRAAA